MGAKANWFIGDLELEQALLERTDRIEQLALPVDLEQESPLARRLVELVTLEAELAARGIRCAIKDRRDTVCSACPLRGKVEADALCIVGVDQEQTATALGVGKVRDATAGVSGMACGEPSARQEAVPQDPQA